MIPVFLSIVEPEGYENLKEEKALELAEPEKIEFLGDLKVYDKKNTLEGGWVFRR